jgi:hypothetical protein
VATTHTSSPRTATASSAAINSYRVVVRRNGLHPVSSCRVRGVDAALHHGPGRILGRVYGMIATAQTLLSASRATCGQNIMPAPGAVLTRP